LIFYLKSSLIVPARLEGYRMEPNRFIGAIARQAGVSVRAIRFYEREGLIGPPARTQKGYRLYSDEEVRQLQFIKKAQLLGFSLKEIEEILALHRQNKVACRHVEQALHKKLETIEQKVRDLRALEASLKRLATTWEKGLPRKLPPASICPYIENAPLLHSMEEKG
jgi:DNA-binding transcriptional MerR regulator